MLWTSSPLVGPDVAKVDSHWMPSECKLARKVNIKIKWETQGKNLEMRLNWAGWFKGRRHMIRTNQTAVTRQGLGPEQRLGFAWEIYNKTMMRMRLKWRNWKAETGTRQELRVGERQDCNKYRQEMSSRFKASINWTEKQTSSQGCSCTRCRLESWPLNSTVSPISEHTHQQKACKQHRDPDDGT